MFLQELRKTAGFTKQYRALWTYHPRTHTFKCPQSFASYSQLTSFCLQTGGCTLARTDLCSHQGLSCYSRIRQHPSEMLWSFTLGSAASHLLRKVLQAVPRMFQVVPRMWRTNSTLGRGTRLVSSQQWVRQQVLPVRQSLLDQRAPEERTRCMCEMVWLSSFRTAGMVGHGWDPATAFSNVTSQDPIALLLPFILQASASSRCARDHLEPDEPSFRLRPCLCSGGTVNAALHATGAEEHRMQRKVFLSNCA